MDKKTFFRLFQLDLVPVPTTKDRKIESDRIYLFVQIISKTNELSEKKIHSLEN